MKIRYKLTLIDQYLIKEYATFQLAALFFLYLVLLINQLLLQATNLLSKNIPFVYIIELLIYASPSVLLWALPFSTIIGALMALSRLVADNEILALRLAGFNIQTLLKPFYLYAIALFLFSLLISNVLIPASFKAFQDVGYKIAQMQAHNLLKSRATRYLGDKIFSIDNVSKNNLTQIIIIDTDENHRQRVIVAPSGTVESTKTTMNIKLNDVSAIAVNRSTNNLNYNRWTAATLNYGIDFTDVIPSTGSDMEGMSMIQLLKAMAKETGLSQTERNSSTADKNLYNRYTEATKQDYNLAEQPSVEGKNPLDNAYLVYDHRRGLFGLNFVFRSLFIHYYEKMSLALLIPIFTYLAFAIAFFLGKAGVGLALALGVLLAVGYWIGVYIARFIVIQYDFSLWFLIIPDLVIVALTIILTIKLRRL